MSTASRTAACCCSAWSERRSAHCALRPAAAQVILDGLYELFGLDNEILCRHMRDFDLIVLGCSLAHGEGRAEVLMEPGGQDSGSGKLPAKCADNGRVLRVRQIK